MLRPSGVSSLKSGSSLTFDLLDDAKSAEPPKNAGTDLLNA